MMLLFRDFPDPTPGTRNVRKERMRTYLVQLNNRFSGRKIPQFTPAQGWDYLVDTGLYDIATRARQVAVRTQRALAGVTMVTGLAGSSRMVLRRRVLDHMKTMGTQLIQQFHMTSELGKVHENKEQDEDDAEGVIAEPLQDDDEDNTDADAWMGPEDADTEVFSDMPMGCACCVLVVARCSGPGDAHSHCRSPR